LESSAQEAADSGLGRFSTSEKIPETQVNGGGQMGKDANRKIE